MTCAVFTLLSDEVRLLVFPYKGWTQNPVTYISTAQTLCIARMRRMHRKQHAPSFVIECIVMVRLAQTLAGVMGKKCKSQASLRRRPYYLHSSNTEQYGSERQTRNTPQCFHKNTSRVMRSSWADHMDFHVMRYGAQKWHMCV